MSMMPFLAFFILVLTGHYFAWILILAAWPQLVKRKYYILGFIALISTGFLSSFATLHNENSTYLTIVYVFFAVLFGFLSQFMLFGFIFFVRNLIVINWQWAKLNCIFPNPKSLARIFIVIIVFFCLLGTYNAFFPRVKKISLDNFSQANKTSTFVHLSDLHLGAIYRPVWLRQIVRQVNNLEADYIIISGDLFDASDISLEEFIPALAEFKAPTIFVSGNHDTYIFGEEVFKTTEAAGIITLNDAVMTINQTEIIGLNFLSNEESDIRREINNLETEKINSRIVVNHAPVDQAEALSLGADLMLSGHAHRGQIFPFSLATSWLYGKYSYGLEKYGEMITYTSAGTGTWGPPFRTLMPGEIILFEIK